MLLCTISLKLRVVQAGVFAAVFEGRVGQVFAGYSGAGGEQGGVEKRRFIVQSHTPAVAHIWQSAICPAAPLKTKVD